MTTSNSCPVCGTKKSPHYAKSGRVWADYESDHPEPDIIRDASYMEAGDIAVIKTSRYAGQLILRTYEGFVSLSDPGHTWEEHMTGLLVAIYPRSAKFQLVRRSKGVG